MGGVPSDPGYMTLLPHPRFRYPNARRFVSRKPRSAPPFNNGRPACGLPLSTNRMRKKKPTRLPSTVPSATNAFGARPAKDRPGAVKNVNAETLMIPGIPPPPSPLHIPSRSPPAATPASRPLSPPHPQPPLPRPPRRLATPPPPPPPPTLPPPLPPP